MSVRTGIMCVKAGTSPTPIRCRLGNGDVCGFIEWSYITGEDKMLAVVLILFHMSYVLPLAIRRNVLVDCIGLLYYYLRCKV